MRHAALAVVLLAACADSADESEPTPGRLQPGVDAAELDGTARDLGPRPDALRPPPGDRDAIAADGSAPPPDASLGETDLQPADLRPMSPDMTHDGSSCTAGTFECPIEVDRFPFEDSQDTSRAPSDAADRYACAPDTDETGPEVVYRVRVPERGLLSARLDDEPGGPDIDLHLLDAPAPEACLLRDNVALSRTVEPGDWWIVADTWTDADGQELAGPYTLTIDFRPLAGDTCALEDLDVEMFWGSCAAGIDCYEGPNADGEMRRFLRTPTTGPMVKEAHLVTVEDDFGGGWPGSFTDEIERHYALSEAATGYAMDRGEPWAPAGEGGSEFGQSAYGRPLPVLDEAWYVNMYWRRRPPAGTRLLIQIPETGRAVVAAGGYETGPGANTAIGGVTEEIHDHLGTGHRDVLLLGFLVDQTLPLGPIDCR